MRILKSAVLYTGLVVVANGASAADIAISDLRSGDMLKLAVHETPQAASDVVFFASDGGETTLADFQGRIALVNFWATWCAPCRAEMPALAALETAFGGEDFAVVTIATGHNPRPAMERFFDEIDVDNLPLNTDPRQALARSMGVLGLPVTVLLDRDGNEIARLIGGADWESESARAIVAALIAPPQE